LVLGVHAHGIRTVCASRHVGTGHRIAGQSAGVEVLVSVGQGIGRVGSVVIPIDTVGELVVLVVVVGGRGVGVGSVVTPMEMVVTVLVVVRVVIVVGGQGGHRVLAGAGHDCTCVCTWKLHPRYGHPQSWSHAWISVAVGIADGHPHGTTSVSWCVQRW
jgi:hypothetical protein